MKPRVSREYNSCLIFFIFIYNFYYPKNSKKVGPKPTLKINYKKKILKTKKKISHKIKMQERCKQSCGQKVPVTL